MLYFPFLLFEPGLLINVAAAVIPAILLLIYVYRLDTVEKEPSGLLVKLLLLGCVAGVLSIGLEELGTRALDATMIDPESDVYQIAMAFLVVAVVEEGTKYVLMKKATWKNPAFNFRFDGIVYAVFTSLGFAAFENVLYVMQLGLGVAFIRAILSIPGHMAFSVVCGIYYGRAKYFEHIGEERLSARNRWKGYLFAVLLHGFYDACLMVGSGIGTLVFVAYVVIMYGAIFRRLKKESRTDGPV